MELQERSRRNWCFRLAVLVGCEKSSVSRSFAYMPPSAVFIHLEKEGLHLPQCGTVQGKPLYTNNFCVHSTAGGSALSPQVYIPQNTSSTNHGLMLEEKNQTVSSRWLRPSGVTRHKLEHTLWICLYACRSACDSCTHLMMSYDAIFL